MKYKLNAQLKLQINIPVEIDEDCENPNQKAYQIADEELYNRMQEIEKIPGVTVDYNPEQVLFTKTLIEGIKVD